MSENDVKERTFLILKPDAVQRGRIGDLISRFESKGMRIVGMKMIRITSEQAQRQYACHKGKPFYDSLIRFMTSGPSVAMVIEGRHAVAVARKIMGATDPLESIPGTIRGDLAVDVKHNLIHGSDSPESVRYEMPIFFNESELFEYEPALKKWFYSNIE